MKQSAKIPIAAILVIGVSFQDQNCIIPLLIGASYSFANAKEPFTVFFYQAYEAPTFEQKNGIDYLVAMALPRENGPSLHHDQYSAGSMGLMSGQIPTLC